MTHPIGGVDLSQLLDPYFKFMHLVVHDTYPINQDSGVFLDQPFKFGRREIDEFNIGYGFSGKTVMSVLEQSDTGENAIRLKIQEKWAGTIIVHPDQLDIAVKQKIDPIPRISLHEQDLALMILPEKSVFHDLHHALLRECVKDGKLA
ncbi:hypothetical protein DNHGIG_09540 [Collibacillus ludicampi]|uniref:Uncharacterized protein n=1 Tax=Collibacillus ludicampi TaxID=2771369 RepID=A0AAV4LCB7_9BACL|nr:hypothetical protein DNHGIG_09540 [Collibacillus ludicampi]